MKKKLIAIGIVVLVIAALGLSLGYQVPTNNTPQQNTNIDSQATEHAAQEVANMIQAASSGACKMNGVVC